MSLINSLQENTATVEWLFCPSDVFYMQAKFNSQTIFRIHPFPDLPIFTVSQMKFIAGHLLSHKIKTKSQSIHESIEKLVEIDPKTNIFYFHIGKQTHRCNNCLIKTPKYKWPQKYTLLLWTEWEPNLSTFTTFDSSSNAPIIGNSTKFATNSNSLGCASQSGGWRYLDDYKLVVNEWQFVIAVGGTDDQSDAKRKTRFFIGSLSSEPKFVGELDIDVCGYETHRIGHYSGRQGPGKVAYIKVYDNHLSEKEILEEYFQSMSSIMIEWKKNEYFDILVVLKEFCESIDVIVNIIVEYCCGNWYLSNL